MDKSNYYFFYGTLQDLDLIQAILPDFTQDQFCGYAHVKDYQAIQAQLQRYPDQGSTDVQWIR